MGKKVNITFNAENVAVPDVVVEDGSDGAEDQKNTSSARHEEKPKLKVVFNGAVPEVDVEDDGDEE